ncbi:TPA: hypothetical protein ACPVYA_004303 [Vibrio parahaemolyticus]|uniref:hypothetical protein n=1 Tax=Vibrio parahaemolyticus TaxID=670 RepID=UPI0002A595FD|nr:hypothetical protein [Vibrio parahaemolyticus]AGB11009.1 hypothetical protein VPBB_2553 [Vibrio parahaemolyticus BB22OP]MBE4138104.1 hypothetical protein [Vibrio parahaemolyticus]MQF42694.1 hypothetical protein [Vibrio parahaemolyticus]TOZ80014.1 hypothetical protein DXJ97_22620 [Vibrio parahaemolyticus]TOZ99733.1 hypothetical protein DXJ96_22640 [Vibrio parahaemolyticus]
MNALNRLMKMHESQVKKAINNLTDMAIDNQELVHIFVSVTPHTNDVTVTAYAADFDWSETMLKAPMMLQSIKLNQDDTLLKLLEVEDQLIDIIAEANGEKENEVTA